MMRYPAWTSTRKMTDAIFESMFGHELWADMACLRVLYGSLAGV